MIRHPRRVLPLLPCLLLSGGLLAAQVGGGVPAPSTPPTVLQVPPAAASGSSPGSGGSISGAVGAAKAALADPALLPDDPTVYLGKGIAEILADRGPPRSMAAIRGPESWQDDVEFSWGDGTRFDWFQDRVWRLEFDADYKGSVFGLFIGDAADKALSLLGQPHFVAEDGLVWRLPWRGYPVQLRVAVKNSTIVDIAVYRADL